MYKYTVCINIHTVKTSNFYTFFTHSLHTHSTHDVTETCFNVKISARIMPFSIQNAPCVFPKIASVKYIFDFVLPRPSHSVEVSHSYNTLRNSYIELLIEIGQNWQIPPQWVSVSNYSLQIDRPPVQLPHATFGYFQIGNVCNT